MEIDYLTALTNYTNDDYLRREVIKANAPDLPEMSSPALAEAGICTGCRQPLVHMFEGDRYYHPYGAIDATPETCEYMDTHGTVPEWAFIARSILGDDND